MTDTKILIARFERQAHRMGELWERCQGKGWPTAEDAEFTALRDERVPATRAAIEAIEAAATAPLLAKLAELEQLNAQIIEGKDWLGNFLGKKLAELEAKLAQRVPDGWKLVSTKADFDQLQAGSAAWHNVSQDDCITDEVRFQRVYAAMLSAAPAAPGQQEPLSTAWAEGYKSGIDDERTSEANIGIAGFGAKVNPNRKNPYDSTKPEHPDNLAVDAFAVAMKEKLAAARAKGRGGWQECDAGVLSGMLSEHVEKGDVRDVADFCMFLWSLGYGIAQAPNAQQAEAPPCAWRFRRLYGADGMEKRSSDWNVVGFCPEPAKDVVIEPLFTRPQPAQLQALSEEEAITAWRGVKDVGDDKYNAILLGEAIQSALAAKNGAVLAVIKAKESK